jgi:hypothetical protein
MNKLYEITLTPEAQTKYKYSAVHLEGMPSCERIGYVRCFAIGDSPESAAESLLILLTKELSAYDLVSNDFIAEEVDMERPQCGYTLHSFGIEF